MTYFNESNHLSNYTKYSLVVSFTKFRNKVVIIIIISHVSLSQWRISQAVNHAFQTGVVVETLVINHVTYEVSLESGMDVEYSKVLIILILDVTLCAYNIITWLKSGRKARFKLEKTSILSRCAIINCCKHNISHFNQLKWEPLFTYY